MRNIFAELDPIFHPRSVALIGASGKPGKIGRVVMDRFLEAGFEKFYPVNPGETEILGVRTFRTVGEIPGPLDMAIVLTPTDSVPSAVRECAARGDVKVIVIITSGFAEAGEKGRAVQKEMVRIARKAGARIIGPNCVGIYYPAMKLPFPLPARLSAGSVGVVSQSGFFADYLTVMATGNGINFSKAISCGNESDLNATDFLEYLGEDPETETIVSYVEGMRDGRRFYNVANQISKKKPIILWKGGVTEAGARAALSHTGALAGSGRVWEGALRQAGVIAVASFEEALDCLYAFHLQPLPEGKRVGIISGPGGTAVGTTDRCLEQGLEVPQFSPHTVEKLSKVLPLIGGSVNNPVDLSLASMVAPHIFGDALRIVAEDENIDMLLVIGVVGGELFRDLILKAVGEMNTRKPLVVTLMTGNMQSVAQDFPLLLRAGISAYSDAARAVKALARLYEYACYRMRSSAAPQRSVRRHGGKRLTGQRVTVIDRALRQGRTTLSEHESKEVLRACAIPVTREKEVHDAQGLKRAVAAIGFPAVIKACGPNVSHKTERGLVRTDIRNHREALAAFKKIMDEVKAEGMTVLVQEMIKGSRELVAGFLRDAQFGPCVMFGLGGIYTEILRDVVFRVAPINKAEAMEMIDEMKTRRILDAARGMPAADKDQLAEILIKVGNIGLEQPAVREIDINPIIISGSRPVAVDALIVLNP